MIVRNEEKLVGQCLKSVADVADELIVVDTGSTDETIPIARSFGAKVIEHPWSDDFSEARNVGLDQASGRWILFLDADERLVSEDIPQLRKVLKKPVHRAYFLTIVNLYGENEESASEHTFPSVRLFRNLPEVRFTGRIHETIMPAKKGETAGLLPVRIMHYGRLASVNKGKRKSERNMRLIELAAQDGDEPVHNRFLEANELLAASRYEEALPIYEQLFQEMKDLRSDNLPGVILDIIRCLESLGRVAESQKWIEIGLAHFPDYTDLEYLRGLAYLKANRYKQALASFRTVLDMGEAPPRYRRRPGISTWGAWEGIGFVHLRLEELDLASNAFREVLSIDPEYAPAVIQLGMILLRTGQPPPQVKEELSKLANDRSPAIRTALHKLSMASPQL